MDDGHDDSEGSAGIVSRFRAEEPTFQHKRRISPSPPRNAAQEPNLPIRKKTQPVHHREDREDFIILGDQSKFRLNMIPYRVRSHSAPRYSDSADMLTWLADDDDDDNAEVRRPHPGDFYNAYSLQSQGDGQSSKVSNNNNAIKTAADDDNTSDASNRNPRETANVKILPSKSVKNAQLQTKNSVKQKPNKATFADSRSQKGILSGAKASRNPPVHIGARPSGSGHFSRGFHNRPRNVTASKSNSDTASILKTKDKNNQKSGELLSRSDVGKYLVDRHREKIRNDKMKAEQKGDARETENRNVSPTVRYEETRKKSDESLGEMIVNRSNENQNNTSGDQTATNRRDPNGQHRKSRSNDRGHRRRTVSEYQNEFQWGGNQNKSVVVPDSSTPLQKNFLNKSLPTLSWFSFDKEPRDLHTEYQDQFRPKSAVDFHSRNQSSPPSRPHHHRHHHHHHHHNVVGQRYYDDGDGNVNNSNPIKNASSLKTGGDDDYGQRVQPDDSDGVDVHAEGARANDRNGYGDRGGNDDDDNDAGSPLDVDRLRLTDMTNDLSIDPNARKDLFHGHHHRNRSEYERKFVSPSEYRFVDGVWMKAGGGHREDLHLNRPILLRDAFKSEYAQEYVDKSKTLSVANDNAFSRRGRFDFGNSRANVDNSINGDGKTVHRSNGLIHNVPYNEAANDARSEVKNNYNNNHLRNVYDSLDDSGNSFNKPGNNLNKPGNNLNNPGNSFNKPGNNFNMSANNFSGVESRFNDTVSNRDNVTKTFVDSTVSSKPPGRDWFDHILELRRKANEYRSRGFGTTFSRDHLAQLRSDNLHFWDASSSDESSEQHYERRAKTENGRRSETMNKNFNSNKNGDAFNQHSHLHYRGNDKAKQSLKIHNSAAENNDFSDGENHPELNAHNSHTHSRGDKLSYPSSKSMNANRNLNSHKVDFAPKTRYHSDGGSNLSDSLSSSLSLAEEVLERAKGRKKRLLSTK